VNMSHVAREYLVAPIAAFAVLWQPWKAT